MSTLLATSLLMGTANDPKASIPPKAANHPYISPEFDIVVMLEVTLGEGCCVGGRKNCFLVNCSRRRRENVSQQRVNLPPRQPRYLCSLGQAGVRVRLFCYDK